MSTDKENISEYYGKTLQSSKDLKTSACCPVDRMPDFMMPLIQKIPDEIQEKFYGCGSPIPLSIEGATVLDLGCGSGRDCYLLSQMVGPGGKVIGIDMTEEQLSIANKYKSEFLDQNQRNCGSIDFKLGEIENLADCGIEENSIDVIISNCVLNLSPDKHSVFKEIFRVLKPGGELYFADIFSDRRIPQSLKKDPVLLGECLSGAMYIEDFRRLMISLSCPDYRIVKKSAISIEDAEIKKQVGMIGFCSLTVRAFKGEYEDRCEDFGQTAAYLGTIPQSPDFFDLDDHHRFNKGKPMKVCGNTAKMISETHYAKHFNLHGDRSIHYGLFEDCGGLEKEESRSSSCC